MSRKLHLNLFIHGRGHHEAAWRHPAASPLGLTERLLSNFSARWVGVA
jgi:hypothetical protein